MLESANVTILNYVPESSLVKIAKDKINMDLGDYFDTYNQEEEAAPRIFGLLFNSSNLISPAYAAAIVLGISFGIAALAGLLYYSLIGGFDSGGGYGGSSGYGSFFSNYLFRRRRSTLEDDTNMVSILESIEDVHKKLSTMNKETTSIDEIDPKELCRIKWSLCHMKQYNKHLVTPNANIERKHNLILFETMLNDIRKLKEKAFLHYLNLGGKKSKARGILMQLDDMFHFGRHTQDGVKCETVLEKCQM